ncbi:MAG TPA: hypothetical protein VGJ37_00020 [Pyrinomonadaceae bacterium]|jgi:hypothetical protein
MRSSRILLASILVSAVLATGCLKDAVKEVTRTVSELMTVRNQLVKKYGEEVNVNVNAGKGQLVLSVTFINSNLNEKTQPERLKRAQETAQIVKAHYTKINDVSVIWVGFMRQTTRLIVFHTNEVLDYFPFDKNGARLQPPESNQPAGVQLQTTAGYLSNSDETDISVSGIQLEGQPGGLGITVLPYFRVRGDARVEPAPAPETVTFNFASYSEKPRFGDTVPIAFISDRKTVIQSKEKFSGNDAQFSYVKVPYPVFRKIIGGTELTIKLGEKSYPLTPAQLAALQQMDAYVKE